MKNILFVCTGNSCRSVMAEGLFRKMAVDDTWRFSVASVGISAVEGFPATPETVAAMKEEGIDVSDHRSRRLTPELAQTADWIFVMEKMHKDWILQTMPDVREKVHLVTEFSSDPATRRETGIPDPIRMSENFYKNVLGVIRDCVGNIVKSLRKEN